MILIQIYTAIFAAVLAWLNRIPCIKMINFGASIREEKEWHRINAIIKILWAFIWPLILFIDGYSFLFCATLMLLLLLIQWVVFDVVLSKLIHNEWFYIGLTSKIDKRFRVIFGEKEGLWKFLICCIVILIINFYV